MPPCDHGGCGTWARRPKSSPPTRRRNLDPVRAIPFLDDAVAAYGPEMGRSRSLREIRSVRAEGRLRSLEAVVRGGPPSRPDAVTTIACVEGGSVGDGNARRRRQFSSGHARRSRVAGRRRCRWPAPGSPADRRRPPVGGRVPRWCWCARRADCAPRQCRRAHATAVPSTTPARSDRRGCGSERASREGNHRRDAWATPGTCCPSGPTLADRSARHPPAPASLPVHRGARHRSPGSGARSSASLGRAGPGAVHPGEWFPRDSLLAASAT